VIIPPDGYLRAVREICSRENVMLILDEVQTGLGRTGKLLAEEHEGIEADLTLIGKALSGGFYPVSAVLSNSEVLGVLKPGEHGSTFGGNPLACRVARAALRVLVEEGMIENANASGAYRPAQIDPHRAVRCARTRADDRRRIPQGGGRRQACCQALKEVGLLCGTPPNPSSRRWSSPGAGRLGARAHRQGLRS
jgi:ornithine--oxo-acid transaminase